MSEIIHCNIVLDNGLTVSGSIAKSEFLTMFRNPDDITTVTDQYTSPVVLVLPAGTQVEGSLSGKPPAKSLET
ncbi:hypothetical protein SH449x_001296 [Pirellulaceae bacterium SH449]